MVTSFKLTATTPTLDRRHADTRHWQSFLCRFQNTIDNTQYSNIVCIPSLRQLPGTTLIHILVERLRRAAITHGFWSTASCINHLQPTGHVMHQQFNIQQLYALPTLCIYVFCIYLRTNSDLRHLQHKLIGFYSGDEKCLQRGTDWVFKYSSLLFVLKVYWLLDAPTV